MKIITRNIYPPIPSRNFDWIAVTDNYEPGLPVGYGPSEQEAIDDLQEQLDDFKKEPDLGLYDAWAILRGEHLDE